jgi:hypothetical protein
MSGARQQTTADIAPTFGKRRRKAEKTIYINNQRPSYGANRRYAPGQRRNDATCRAAAVENSSSATGDATNQLQEVASVNKAHADSIWGLNKDGGAGPTGMQDQLLSRKKTAQ